MWAMVNNETMILTKTLRNAVDREYLAQVSVYQHIDIGIGQWHCPETRHRTTQQVSKTSAVDVPGRMKCRNFHTF